MDRGHFVVDPSGYRSFCFCFGPFFSNLVLDALSRSAIILLRKMAGCLSLNKAWLSVSIPHGVMGQSAVCDYDISSLYSFVESIIEPRHEVFNNVICATSKASDQSAHTRSLLRAFACHLNILCVLSY